MSMIENTVPRLLVSLFSVDGREPATGATILANGATIETLDNAFRNGHYEGVTLVTPITDHILFHIVEAAERLKAIWYVDELDDNEIDPPSCSDNYAWRVVDGHAYLVFEAHGLCGIRGDDIARELDPA